MTADIITIGDEILIGQVIDSNSAFISKQLNKIGVSVYQITSVQDDRSHILQSLKEAGQRSQLVIITGGLGPTKDDITKQTFCEYFGDTLVENKEVLAHVEHLFAKFANAPMLDVNRKQAWVPSKAAVLNNPYGTAPGMWMEQGGTVYVSLPGVPYEMENLMVSEVVPRIEKHFQRPAVIHRTLVTYGMGESAIAQRIETWEDALPSHIKLAYLPNLGKVRLRLSGKGPDKQRLETEILEQVSQLKALISDILFGEEDDESLEVAIGKILTKKELSLATAESFTGGAIAERITSIPGASHYFKGSIVSYATEVKTHLLQVPKDAVEKYSVVSAEVAIAMARNVQKILKTDFAVATTGNAGPTKGDSDAEVGTVYIGIATPTGVTAHQFNFGRHRLRVVEKSVNKAFELLWKELQKF